jgi:glucose uptake protein GlcU
MVKKGAVHRTLLVVGSAILVSSLVLTEPERLADIAIAFVGVVMLFAGLYLSQKAENETVEKAKEERELFAVEPDVAPEEEDLPRRSAFDEQD